MGGHGEKDEISTYRMTQRIPNPIDPDWNGYEAWLRYEQRVHNHGLSAWMKHLGRIDRHGPEAAVVELKRAIRSLTGQPPALAETEAADIVFRRIEDGLPEEGFRLTREGQRISLASPSDAGLLYGTFALIRHMQLGRLPSGLSIQSSPSYRLRMLNHWDDPKFDHTIGPYNVTRGFAGNSIFNWEDLAADDPRYTDYARLLASVGINATCINNVNADPDLLETAFLPKLAAVADRLRPYGIRLFLAVCFSAPMITDGEPGEQEYGSEYPFNMRHRKVRLGCLDTANPQDPRVRAWWADKATEIYRLIPDFGGFVIKANSEGMPGPQEYGLSHAAGANCVARALAPHGGTLFWRTFVYGDTLRDVPPTDPRGDGCCQPYLEFKPLDGQFDANVILQTKNGPADFRADEPPSSLLGAVPSTRQAVEFMIAQEYLGHTSHICYQAAHWHDVLNFDTFQQGPGSTVAAATAGMNGYPEGAMVGVANLGDDPNWFGHLLAGANLYAFGSLAWDPSRDPREIAEEWTGRTFGHNPKVNPVVTRILMESYPTFARYAAPLGLGNMHEPNHHYEPYGKRLTPRIWNPSGAGFDRTVETGSQYLGQYTLEAASRFARPESCPLRQLLFFHHLPWDYEMPDGRSLAQYVAEDRIAAVETVRDWLEAWRSLQNELDAQTFAHVYERMQRQYVHAGKWRDEGLRAMRRVGQFPNPEPAARRAELVEAP